MWTQYSARYQNIPMRSKLEAQWAAFFDGRNITWEYEPVRFRRYTPDFGILGDCSCFVEVKGIGLPLVNRFDDCKFPLIVVIGPPMANPQVFVKPAHAVHLERRRDWDAALNNLANTIEREDERPSGGGITITRTSDGR